MAATKVEDVPVEGAVDVLSYNGRLAFGVTGDFDTAPDVGVLAKAIKRGIKELKKLATKQPR